MKKTRIFAGSIGLLIIGAVVGAYCHLIAGQQPDLYDQVAALNSAYERKVIVNAADPVAKVKLWNRQLDYALAHEDLTPEERAVIGASRGFLSVQAFKKEITMPLDVEKAVGDLFVSNGHVDLYRRTFIIPGNDTPSDNITCEGKYKQSHPGVAGIFRHVPFAFFFQGGGDDGMGIEWTPYCNCNWSMGCDSNSCGNNPCRSTSENCGLFGLSPCYYVCV